MRRPFLRLRPDARSSLEGRHAVLRLLRRTVLVAFAIVSLWFLPASRLPAQAPGPATPAGGTASAGDATITVTGTSDPAALPPAHIDTDGDGLTDADELARTGSNPQLADTDGDGVSDLTDGWPRTPWLHPARLPEVRYAMLRIGQHGFPFGKGAVDIDDKGNILFGVGHREGPSMLWIAATGEVLAIPAAAGSISDGPQGNVIHFGALAPDGVVYGYRSGSVTEKGFIRSYEPARWSASQGSAYTPVALPSHDSQQIGPFLPSDWFSSEATGFVPATGSFATADRGGGAIISARDNRWPYLRGFFVNGILIGGSSMWIPVGEFGINYVLHDLSPNIHGIVLGYNSHVDHGDTPLLADLNNASFTQLPLHPTLLTNGAAALDIPEIVAGWESAEPNGNAHAAKYYWGYRREAGTEWIFEQLSVYNPIDSSYGVLEGEGIWQEALVGNDRLEITNGHLLIRNGMLRPLADDLPPSYRIIDWGHKINASGIILKGTSKNLPPKVATEKDRSEEVAKA